MNLGAWRERCNGSHAYGRCEQQIQGDKYYEMFRGKGGEGMDEGSGSGDGARPFEGDEAFV